MENVASKVLKRIEKMLEEKQSSLSVIQDLLKAEYEKEAEVKKEILNAQANMDFELYHELKARLAEIREKIELLNSRQNQLASAKLITEEESDRVIDSLLQYEAELANAYEKAIIGEIKLIRTTHDLYRSSVNEAEKAIATWTSNIHPNYRSSSTRYHNGSNRADRPVAVHPVAYLGSPLSHIIDSLLKKAESELGSD